MILENIILGSGPSGLSYALLSNKKIKILEKNNYPGGHASSFQIKDFTFDYGPHILFSKDKDILNFILKTLKNNVARCKRKNFISYKKKLIKYPFENDLGSLEPKENFDCLIDILQNPYKIKYTNPKNMREWFLKYFGKSICEKYLFPYNRKVWNIDPKDMSMSWSERIPKPPLKDIIRSSLGIPTEGYKHQLYYHYPKKGGYQAICNNWSRNSDVDYNETVVHLEKKRKYFEIHTKKKIYKSQKVISTISLNDLVKIYKVPIKIKNLVNKLIINPMYVVSLAIQGNDKNKFTALYFPEKEFLFNRVSFPKTFSNFNSPKNTYSIQAEITFRANSKLKNISKKKIINHVIKGLKKNKILEKNHKILFTDIKSCKESYVVYDKNYEKRIKIIRNFFKRQGIDLLGRFSYFEYINIDMAVERSLKLICENNKKKFSNNLKRNLLKRALKKFNDYN
jgi:protoporphyrinogen oxidase